MKAILTTENFVDICFDLTKRCLDAEHDALDVPMDDDHHVLGERHHRMNGVRVNASQKQGTA